MNNLQNIFDTVIAVSLLTGVSAVCVLIYGLFTPDKEDKTEEDEHREGRFD